jgi:hypothetical protein
MGVANIQNEWTTMDLFFDACGQSALFLLFVSWDTPCHKGDASGVSAA